jgi:SAM-dependent methyltransferase
MTDGRAPAGAVGGMPTAAGRARCSPGRSGDAVYALVAGALSTHHRGGGTLLDVGCGRGNLWAFTRHLFDRYLAADAVRYEELPPEAEFHPVELDHAPVPLPAGCADVVACVETIEHLENPRALARELVRLARPGGWVAITTPNQLSALSKATLVLRNEFNSFQRSCYPAHLTALVEADLRRIAAECGLEQVGVTYSGEGRLVFTSRSYPRWLSRLLPRACSDTVLLLGRKPATGGRP